MKLLFIYLFLFFFPFLFTFISVCVSKQIYKQSAGAEIPGMLVGIASFIVFWSIAVGMCLYQIIFLGE